ncbi:MAG: hypothetical protein J6J87_01305 [Oscillospiraceae bacterium]|nr:hypothetical protein [Oscillospiraceae bacterium]
MCEILRDGLIGLISGIISSTVVTICFSIRDKKRREKEGFGEDVQTFHRYLLRIRSELDISYRLGDYSSIIRAIEAEPILYYFDNLSETSAKEKREISDFVESLKEKYGNEKDNNILKAEIIKDSSTLFRYSIDVLKFTKNRKSAKKH